MGDTDNQPQLENTTMRIFNLLPLSLREFAAMASVNHATAEWVVYRYFQMSIPDVIGYLMMEAPYAIRFIRFLKSKGIWQSLINRQDQSDEWKLLLNILTTENIKEYGNQVEAISEALNHALTCFSQETIKMALTKSIDVTLKVIKREDKSLHQLLMNLTFPCYINLSKANLSGVKLPNVNLSWAKLTAANLTSGHFYMTNFSGADFFKAILFYADLQHAVFDYANLDETDFQGAELVFSSFQYARLSHVNFTKQVLWWTNFSNATITYSVFNEAKLCFSRMEDANFYEVKMMKAVLYNASFYHSVLNRVNLVEADLARAHILEANFFKSNLLKTNLENAVLSIIEMDKYGNIRPMTRPYFYETIATINLSYIVVLQFHLSLLNSKKMTVTHINKMAALALLIENMNKNLEQPFLKHIEVWQAINLSNGTNCLDAISKMDEGVVQRMATLFAPKVVSLRELIDNLCVIAKQHEENRAASKQRSLESIAHIQDERDSDALVVVRQMSI